MILLLHTQFDNELVGINMDLVEVLEPYSGGTRLFFNQGNRDAKESLADITRWVNLGWQPS